MSCVIDFLRYNGDGRKGGVTMDRRACGRWRRTESYTRVVCRRQSEGEEQEKNAQTARTCRLGRQPRRDRQRADARPRLSAVVYLIEQEWTLGAAGWRGKKCRETELVTRCESFLLACGPRKRQRKAQENGRACAGTHSIIIFMYLLPYPASCH